MARSDNDVWGRYAMPTKLSWLFPDGVPRGDNGPDPFGYNPPFVPPKTLPPGELSTLSV